MTGPWHAVDGGGRHLGGGRPSPAAALAAAPVMAWPVAVLDGDGGRLSLAGALGPGGDRVERLLGADGLDEVEVEALLRATPVGPEHLKIRMVGLRATVEAAAAVDGAWLAAVDRRRTSLRDVVVAAGRREELEAALHVAMLLGTERFDPADDTDVDAHVASGARLWLLTAAVVSALAAAQPDPFESWGRLSMAGWWPVGPSGGRLVVGRPCRPLRTGDGSGGRDHQICHRLPERGDR